MQRFGRRGRTTLLDQRVGAFEAEEGDRDRPMFRGTAASLHVRPNRGRQTAQQRLRRHLRPRDVRNLRVVTGRFVLEQHARGLRLAKNIGRQERRRFGADEDFVRFRGMLHRDGDASRRGRGQHLEVRRADREEMEATRVNALRHAQRDLRAGQVDPTDLIERAAHAHGRGARVRHMIVALEPEEERIAAELEQAGAVLVGDLEDRCEAAANGVADLFGALAPLARELLGQRRESRDVGEHRRAFRGPARRVRIGQEVLLQDAREVRNDALGVFLRRRRSCGIGGHEVSWLRNAALASTPLARHRMSRMPGKALAPKPPMLLASVQPRNGRGPIRERTKTPACPAGDGPRSRREPLRFMSRGTLVMLRREAGASGAPRATTHARPSFRYRRLPLHRHRRVDTALRAASGGDAGRARAPPRADGTRHRSTRRPHFPGRRRRLVLRRSRPPMPQCRRRSTRQHALHR